MSIEDKIKSSVPIMRRVFDIEKIVYGSIQENGYFLTFNENKILEFDTSQIASDNALALNQAISPILSSLRSSARQQINTILNA